MLTTAPAALGEDRGWTRGSAAGAALGKKVGGTGGKGRAGFQEERAGTLVAEPGLCALAGAGEGQVRRQHLPPQTLPSRRPASRWRCPGRPVYPDSFLNPLERSTSDYLLLSPTTPKFFNSKPKKYPNVDMEWERPPSSTACHRGRRSSPNLSSHDLGS